MIALFTHARVCQEALRHFLSQWPGRTIASARPYEKIAVNTSDCHSSDPDRGADYCDERVCQSVIVCVCVCVFAGP